MARQSRAIRPSGPGTSEALVHMVRGPRLHGLPALQGKIHGPVL